MMNLPSAEVIERRMRITGELDELFLTHRRRLAQLYSTGEFRYRVELDPRSDVEYWRRLAADASAISDGKAVSPRPL